MGLIAFQNNLTFLIGVLISYPHGCGTKWFMAIPHFDLNENNFKDTGSELSQSTMY